jgi:hypothetical protein
MACSRSTVSGGRDDLPGIWARTSIGTPWMTPVGLVVYVVLVEQSFAGIKVSKTRLRANVRPDSGVGASQPTPEETLPESRSHALSGSGH